MIHVEDYTSPLDRENRERRRDLTRIPRNRFAAYLAILIGAAILYACNGCEGDTRNFYEVVAADSTECCDRHCCTHEHTDDCVRVDTPFGGTWVCAPSDQIPPVIKDPRPTHGNPDFNVGGGSGGGVQGGQR